MRHGSPREDQRIPDLVGSGLLLAGLLIAAIATLAPLDALTAFLLSPH